MKKPINEAAKLKRLAGLITESEYQESLMNETMYYVHDEEGMEEPIGPFTMDQAKQELAKQGAGWKMIDAATAKQIWSYLEDDMNEAKEKEEGFGGINENALRNSFLSPEAYDRMSGLSNTRAQQAMIKAAEIMMNDLTAEGFEVEEIKEFFHILIANDI